MFTLTTLWTLDDNDDYHDDDEDDDYGNADNDHDNIGPLRTGKSLC